MKDKRKDHGAVDKPSSEKQFLKYVDGKYFCCVKILEI